MSQTISQTSSSVSNSQVNTAEMMIQSSPTERPHLSAKDIAVLEFIKQREIDVAASNAEMAARNERIAELRRQRGYTPPDAAAIARYENSRQGSHTQYESPSITTPPIPAAITPILKFTGDHGTPTKSTNRPTIRCRKSGSSPKMDEVPAMDTAKCFDEVIEKAEATLRRIQLLLQEDETSNDHHQNTNMPPITTPTSQNMSPDYEVTSPPTHNEDIPTDAEERETGSVHPEVVDELMVSEQPTPDNRISLDIFEDSSSRGSGDQESERDYRRRSDSNTTNITIPSITSILNSSASSDIEYGQLLDFVLRNNEGGGGNNETDDAGNVKTDIKALMSLHSDILNDDFEKHSPEGECKNKSNSIFEPRHSDIKGQPKPIGCFNDFFAPQPAAEPIVDTMDNGPQNTNIASISGAEEGKKVKRTDFHRKVVEKTEAILVRALRFSWRVKNLVKKN